MKTPPAPISRARRIWRWIFRSVLALILLLLLAAGGFAWWLWGWQVGGLRFHESWTPEQRADLQALHENYVKGMVQDCLALQDEWDAALSNIKDSSHKELGAGLIKRAFFPLNDLPALIQYIELSIGFRPVCIRMDEVLRHVAATGRADYYCAENNLSAAYIAARCGKLDLVKELVLRGNDPNLPLLILPEKADDEDAPRYETVFQAAIACAPYFRGESPPLAQRLELLEWLLAHGADINAYARQGQENMPLLIATIACIRENEQLPPEQRGRLLLWLLDHGLQVEPGMLIHMQLAACHPSLLPRIVEKVYPGSPTPEQKARILHAFLADQVQYKVAKVRWALEVLGADPNLPVKRDKLDDDEEARHEMPTMWLATYFSFSKEPLDAEEEAEFAERLEALDLLLAHGGRVERPGNAAPTPPALRERYLAVLRKNGIDLQMPDGLDLPRLCALMQQTGTLQQVQDIFAREHISTLYYNERQKLAQAVLQGGAEDAPEKLAWLLSKGNLPPEALSYWEAAWRPYKDAASMAPETQAAAFKQLQLLDQLLSVDDDLPSPQQLTPADPELKARYLDILKKHHIDPSDEETP